MWLNRFVLSLPPLYPHVDKLAQINEIEVRICLCNNCFIVSNFNPRTTGWSQGYKKEAPWPQANALWEILWSYWKYVGACYCSGGWIFSSIQVFFFSDVCKQRFQNLTIILGIDSPFLSLTSGWDHMSLNDSILATKKKKKRRDHFATGLGLTDLLWQESRGPPGCTFLLCSSVVMIDPHFITCDNMKHEWWGHFDVCLSNVCRCQHIVGVVVSLNDARPMSKQHTAYWVFSLYFRSSIVSNPLWPPSLTNLRNNLHSTVLILIFVDTVGSCPLCWLLHYSTVSLPSKNFLCNAYTCIWLETVVAVNRSHFFEHFCWNLSS